MSFAHLSRPDIAPDDARYPEAWRRVLPRLGEYVELIARKLNLRPLAVNLLVETPDSLVLAVKLPGDQVALKLAPGGDLAGEVFFLRALAGRHAPVPRLIHADLECSLVPCPFVLMTYIGGVGVDAFPAPHQQQALGRQLGRALRLIHRHGAPGFGAPLPSGRWPQRGWQAALAALHASSGAAVWSQLLFDEGQWARLRAATLDHAGLLCEQPSLIHGALRPDHLICTRGEHARLEALVAPGPLVGGDPLFDLACCLLPSNPLPFRVGLMDAYGAALGPGDEQRLARLRLLTCAWEACRRYSRGENHEPLRAAALALLDTLDD
jgi:aminoglycoside phosphotransferase (APT) family kinase protein